MKGKLALLILIFFNINIFCENPDGIITKGEYPNSISAKKNIITLYWKLEQTKILIGIKAKTSGWVAIGFNPTKVMKDADMVFGWVDTNGNAKALDCYSTGIFGPHPPDTDLGGTENISAFGATETNGITIFEFERILSTGDEYDAQITAGNPMVVIWGIGAVDNYLKKHKQVGSFDIDFGSKASVRNTVPLWPLHAAVMAVSFILMLGGILIARYLKKKKWRIKVHRRTELTGAFIGVIGIILMFVIIAFAGENHLKIFHSILGLVSGCLLVLNVMLGYMFLKLKSGKKPLRLLHRWNGYTALLFMAITIIFGILHVF